ncbi:hypothetical protein [Vibrio sp. VPAP30]|uniref:hypothetical protein n=1 Tax=Vibrio sp. VPAP30 TaxID=1647102 RepID=UPI000659D75F|nr:hypothetical protein [Vibrio sp. VPAP30]KLN66036.1 hypothetical protein ZX61_06540 [Vibrio sp. VPAP30]
MHILTLTNYPSYFVNALRSPLKSNHLVTTLSLASLNEGTHSIQALMTAHLQPYEAILVDLRWNEQSELQTIFDSDELASSDDIPSTRSLTTILDFIRQVIAHNLVARVGKFLFLLYDDSFGYFTSKHSAPIYNQAIRSLSRSLAKEYARYQLNFNVIIYHPELKELPGSATHKRLLNNFVLKYQSIDYLQVTDFIEALITHTWPFNGATFRVGSGAVDYV